MKRDEAVILAIFMVAWGLVIWVNTPATPLTPQPVAPQPVVVKPVVYFFTATWCQYCTKFKQTTLKDEAVQKALAAYDFKEVDADKEPELAKKFGIGGLPAFAKADKPVSDHHEGYMGVKPFLTWLAR